MSHAEAPFVVEPPGDPSLAGLVAAAAAGEWGLPEPVHLRTGMCALYATGDDVVLRVCRPTAPAAAAIELADLLEGHGVRIARHLRDEPFTRDGLAVFAIERIVPARPVDWEEVGAMVARVHTLPPDEVAARYPLPWCGSFRHWRIDELLAELSPLLDEDDRTVLHDALRSAGDWRAELAAAPTRVCHGDVHPGNVMQSADGAVLLDWDLMCHGAAAWDHAPLMTWSERWGGEPGLYERFAAGAGEDFRDDPLGDTLSLLRNLVATLMRVRAGRTDVTAAAEARRRLRYWHGDADAPVWQAM